MDKKIRIHSRNISIDCFEVGDDLMLLEGSLGDDRLFPSYYHAIGEHHNPEILHHITLSMTISLPGLVITSVKAEMPTIPNEECFEVKEIAGKLVGLRIKHGFTKNVRNIMGGTSGCIHLTNLVLAMGSTAVQGFASYCTRVREDNNNKLPDFDASVFINSCRLWRADGLFVTKIKEFSKHKYGGTKN